MSEHKDDLCELAELYVLGALTAEEAEQFTAHAASCDECKRLVEDYNQVLDYLPLAAEPAEPPSGMKERILSRVLTSGEAAVNASIADSRPDPGLSSRPAAERLVMESEPEQPRSHREGLPAAAIPEPRKTHFWGFLSLGLAVAVLLLLVYTSQLRSDVGQLKREIAADTGPLQGLKVNESVALNPAGDGISAKGVATIVTGTTRSYLVIQAEDLPELTGTEVYQVWLIKGDSPQNAGTFLSQDGNGALYYSFDPQAYDTVAITLEPADGGEVPHGQMILAAPIKQG